MLQNVQDTKHYDHSDKNSYKTNNDTKVSSLTDSMSDVPKVEVANIDKINANDGKSPLKTEEVTVDQTSK